MDAIKPTPTGDGYFMKIRSNRGGFVVVAVSDIGARCIGAENGPELFGDGEYRDCPACTYGRTCWRCKGIDHLLGIGDSNVSGEKEK